MTGLVVDTGSYWSGFGQGVILGLIQVGGFGIMTMASLLALLIAGKLRLRMQLTAQAETKTLGLGDVRGVVSRVALISLVIESVTAVLLTARFRLGYGQPFGDALYSGSSTPSPPSTTPASACTPTAWSATPPTPGSLSRWPRR